LEKTQPQPRQALEKTGYKKKNKKKNKPYFIDVSMVIFGVLN
jgi:hypothetical protein